MSLSPIGGGRAEIKRSERGLSLKAEALVILLLLTGCQIYSSNPQPVGPWHLVKSGMNEKTSWALFSTAVNKGGRCLAIEINGAGENSSTPKDLLYKGRGSYCLATPADTMTRVVGRYVQVIDVPNCQSRGFDCLIGLVSPEVSKVKVGLKAADSPAADVEVETSDGYFVLLHEPFEVVSSLQPMSNEKALEECQFTPEDRESQYKC
jgi:hypothetical protein